MSLLVKEFMPRYIKFEQNKNFVILARNSIKLSEGALKELKLAHANSLGCEGWSILPARAKIALVLDGLMRKIYILRENTLGSNFSETQWVLGEPYVWEAIEFLPKVIDVFPFRDTNLNLE